VSIQNAMPPHEFRCVVCGERWLPEPAKSGKHKGQHTDHSLNASAVKHFLKCSPSEQ
jgi:hypothetical protein